MEQIRSLKEQMHETKVKVSFYMGSFQKEYQSNRLVNVFIHIHIHIHSFIFYYYVQVVL